MNKFSSVLKILLVALCGYFLAMSAAHFTGFKVPMLFIYYDVPSEVYQDKIISFCAFSYAMFAIAALRSRGAVVPFILAMAGVVVGLSLVNLSASLRNVIGDAATFMYWIQTALIASVLIILAVLHIKSRR